MNTQVRIPIPQKSPGAAGPARPAWRVLRRADPWLDEVIRAQRSGTALAIYRGACTVYVEGTPHEVAAGDVLWIPAGVPFGMDCRDARGRAAEIPRGSRLPARPRIARGGADAALDPAATIADGLARVLGEAEDLRRPSASERLVKAFLHQLEAGFDEGLRVQDHADRLGITATHLSRVCRAVTGHTAVRLCTRRVVAEARERLAETGRPVGEIGAALGYASPSYFTRDFQLRCGVTPSGFRAAVRRGDKSVLTRPDVASRTCDGASPG